MGLLSHSCFLFWSSGNMILLHCFMTLCWCISYFFMAWKIGRISTELNLSEIIFWLSSIYQLMCVCSSMFWLNSTYLCIMQLITMLTIYCWQDISSYTKLSLLSDVLLWTGWCKCIMLTAREWFSQFTFSLKFRESSAGTSATISITKHRWPPHRVLRRYEKYGHVLFSTAF